MTLKGIDREQIYMYSRSIMNQLIAGCFGLVGLRQLMHAHVVGLLHVHCIRKKTNQCIMNDQLGRYHSAEESSKIQAKENCGSHPD